MSVMYVSNNVDTFIVPIRKNLGSFRKRFLSCGNKLISCIAIIVSFIFNSSHSAKWQDLLFT